MFDNIISLFTINQPFYIFLVIPIIVSSLTTSTKMLYYLDILVLFVFGMGVLIIDMYFIDGWVILLSLFVVITYKNKDRIQKLFTPSEKVEFSEVEKYVYDREFKLLFTEEEFKTLMSIAQLKTTHSVDFLALEQDKFDRIIYLVTIPAYRSVMLQSKETVISYLHDGAWLGVVEFILHLNDQNNKNWLVSVLVEKDISISYYEWDLVSIKNLFQFSSEFKFLNKLLLMWMKYLTFSVGRLDDHVANALKAMVYHDKKAIENTLPICK
jgi:hypothetical protein